MITIKHYDFRRARIRISKDGKTWYIADKYTVVKRLQDINQYKYMYADVVYSYEQCKEALLKELKALNDPNIEIITNE